MVAMETEARRTKRTHRNLCWHTALFSSVFVRNRILGPLPNGVSLRDYPGTNPTRSGVHQLVQRV